jgi:hypothetical protein
VPKLKDSSFTDLSQLRAAFTYRGFYPAFFFSGRPSSNPEKSLSTPSPLNLAPFLFFALN